MSFLTDFVPFSSISMSSTSGAVAASRVLPAPDLPKMSMRSQSSNSLALRIRADTRLLISDTLEGRAVLDLRVEEVLFAIPLAFELVVGLD